MLAAPENSKTEKAARCPILCHLIVLQSEHGVAKTHMPNKPYNDVTIQADLSVFTPCMVAAGCILLARSVDRTNLKDGGIEGSLCTLISRIGSDPKNTWGG